MHNDTRGPSFNRKRLHYRQQTLPGGVLGRVAAFIGTVILAGIALLFGTVLFALVIAAGMIVWGYFWWKTRDLRKQLREQFDRSRAYQTTERPPAGADILEGEVIREIRADGEDGDPRF